MMVVLLGVTRVWPALLAWEREARGAAQESATELARAQESVERLAATRDTLIVRRQRLAAAATGVLEGESLALAAGALSALLADMAADAGVRLGAVQLRPDSASDSRYARVAVSVDATGDVRGVTALLSAIEGDSTLLVVRSLSISQPEPAAPSDRPELLRVELVVEGVARGKQLRRRS
jgi:hypothetical protein